MTGTYVAVVDDISRITSLVESTSEAVQSLAKYIARVIEPKSTQKKMVEEMQELREEERKRPDEKFTR